jgi:hypothetical protein
MKTEQTECSETSAYKIQAPGNYAEENIQHSEQGENLKSRMIKDAVVSDQVESGRHGKCYTSLSHLFFFKFCSRELLVLSRLFVVILLMT